MRPMRRSDKKAAGAGRLPGGRATAPVPEPASAPAPSPIIPEPVLPEPEREGRAAPLPLRKVLPRDLLCRRMGRGMLIFALVFLVLPLLTLLAVWLLDAGLTLAILAIVLLLTGFAIGVPMFDVADRDHRRDARR